MIGDRFGDIVLSEGELLEIEVKVAEVERTTYTGEMPAHNKAELRRVLTRQMKEGIWSNRDYVYGQDEGEPPRGANW
jgi:hypothetical protein